ncbi:hypothetical protein GGR56DRAFT_624135 [Xylariaceae sp. FL0804]|nr:hypothetical protein GGR56DRAFT_624135 [Xylariaceae sp. FL0804]
MADIPPAAKVKKALPFKRTVRRISSSEAADNNHDDGLSLFQRSKDFFPTVIEDQQRRALEKAAKAEEERKEKLAAEKGAAERIKQEKDVSPEPTSDVDLIAASSTKRRRHSWLSSDEDRSDDDTFAGRPRKRKPSLEPPWTPTRSSRREKSCPKSSRGPGSSRITRSRKNETSVIALVDSSDEDSKARVLLDFKKSPDTKRMDEKARKATSEGDDDSEIELAAADPATKTDEAQEEDPAAIYIRQAMERRLAREASGAHQSGDGGSGSGGQDELKVDILIGAEAGLNMRPQMYRVKLRQQLRVAFDTWQHQLRGLTHAPDAVVNDVVFTWRRNQVYATSSLATLGIRSDRDGAVVPRWKPVDGERAGSDGFASHTRVYFEAWTRDAYEDLMRERERARQRRELYGDIDEDDDDDDHNDDGGDGGGNEGDANTQHADDAPTGAPENERCRIILKPKDLPPQRIRVKPDTCVAHMIRVFRRMARLPPDKTIELHWDGERLAPETTIQEADIEDMETIEVHIK